MAMTPRYYLKGLNVKSYNATYTYGTTYTDVVTSEYDYETKTFGKLGTVFKIRAYGYAAYVESTAADPLAEVRAIRFDGASRLVMYPDTADGHPVQIEALVGFHNTNQPAHYGGYYLTPESESLNISGIYNQVLESVPSYLYITPVYMSEDDAEAYGDPKMIRFFVSPNSSFTAAGNYPAQFVTVGSNFPEAPWIMSYVEPILLDTYINSLQLGIAAGLALEGIAR